MKIRVGGEWRDGYLDPYRAPGEARVQVLAVMNLERLRSVYVERRRSVRMVWNYLREVGPRAVLLRVRSRSGEAGRNEKYVSCGLGRVIEGPADGPAAGSLVWFVAPAHPSAAERLVLPPALLAPADDPGPVPAAEGTVAHLDAGDEGGERWWAWVRGWSGEAGIPLDPARCRALLDRAARALRGAAWGAAARSAPSPPTPVAERAEATAPPGEAKKTAVLFGYGNYAKVTSLPHVERSLTLTAIHEIDPTQVPRDRRGDVAWDSAPVLRAGERADAVLIAGFHHTHAPLAVEALRRGAYAVVEKPLCTTREQLRALMEAVERAPRLFACFHKRYSPLNALASEDLGVAPGAPVNYHCVVYEIPLPELHWYRWPSSRTRLVSNGCHWIDHFLYLNAFSRPAAYDVLAAPDETLNVSVTLENGAFFTMVLTDRGSERIGVQEHIELRAGDRTVRMVNASEYHAESSERLLRRTRVNKLDGYGLMYGAIARAIAAGEPGDTPESVRLSSELVLELEAMLASRPVLGGGGAATQGLRWGTGSAPRERVSTADGPAPAA